MRAFSSLRAVLQNCTMRVLIVAVAVFACAAASPSGLLAAPFAHGYAAPLAVAHAAPLAYAHAPVAVAHAAPALPTISPGDVNGAIIDAHVNAADHTRAAVDAVRQVQDKHAELHGQAVNAAVDHSWRAVDAVKTQEAQLDGAAAGVAPVLAKQIAGQAAYAAPVAYAAHAAPVAYGYAAPVLGYAAPALAHGYAAPALAHGYAAPALAHGYATPALAHGYAAPALGYAAAPVAHYSQAPVAYAHGW